MEIMNGDHIYPIHLMSDAPRIMQMKYPQVQTIIFYTDGTDFGNPENKIPFEITRDFKLEDSAFYPQCIHVLIYKKIKR